MSEIIISKIYTRGQVECLQMVMQIIISLGLCGMMPSRSTIVLRNMVGKANEYVFVVAVARVLVG